MKRNIRLYNIFFPIWTLLLFYPLCWLAVLPVNFAVDLLVIVLSLKLMKADNIKSLAKQSILKVWGLGFAADIIGGLFMWLSQAGKSGWWYDHIANSVMFSPFDNIFSILWVLMCALISAVLIYLFNMKWGLAAMADKTQRRKVALALAVLTAPYTFFIPTPMPY